MITIQMRMKEGQRINTLVQLSLEGIQNVSYGLYGSHDNTNLYKLKQNMLTDHTTLGRGQDGLISVDSCCVPGCSLCQR